MEIDDLRKMIKLSKKDLRIITAPISSDREPIIDHCHDKLNAFSKERINDPGNIIPTDHPEYLSFHDFIKELKTDKEGIKALGNSLHGLVDFWLETNNFRDMASPEEIRSLMDYFESLDWLKEAKR